MQPHQSITNTVAKRGHSSELNKWRDAGVDPELLYVSAPVLAEMVGAERLAPNVAAWDKTLQARDLGGHALALFQESQQA